MRRKERGRDKREVHVPLISCRGDREPMDRESRGESGGKPGWITLPSNSLLNTPERTIKRVGGRDWRGGEEKGG